MKRRRNDETKKMVKTYCYGTLHEFTSRKEAIKFYWNGWNSCEGSERDRYLTVYSKLVANEAPFCDCDGVPAPKKAVKRTLTAEDIAKAREIVEAKRNVANSLDALRAKLDLKQRDFNRENAELINDIWEMGEKWNNLALQLIKFEKLGFKA